MPTVSVFQDSLAKHIGQEQTTEQAFTDLCFEFGLELDDVTSEYEMVLKERGREAAEGMDKRVVYKIDIPANRYDLLCLEGLVRGLKIFFGKMQLPNYVLKPPKPTPNMKMIVKASCAKVRPYVVCAALRGVTYDADKFKSFIDLQDKLHQNIGRRREFVSIGTHDLSTISGPFTYEALPPKDIKFVPLYQTEEMDGYRTMEVLSTHQQLKHYLHLIRDSPVYPVIFDSKRTVLSLPPIINGSHSKMSEDTKDVFIEVTATDLTKANIVLNTVVSDFSTLCKEPFTIEPVEIIYEKDYPANKFVKGGDSYVTPDIKSRHMEADLKQMMSALCLDLKGDQVCKLLNKMSLPCNIDKKNPAKLQVQVPMTRSDIMHQCDLVEDLAIAYGYNNLVTEMPATLHWPKMQPVNHLTDLLRLEVAQAGYTECLNWGLLALKENFTYLRREPKPEELWRAVAQPHEYNYNAVPVEIANPKTKEFEIVRTSILPCLMKTLHSNKHTPPPIKLYEIGDVVIQEPTRETRSRNVRRVAAVMAGMKAEFEKLHGLLDQILWSLSTEAQHLHDSKSKKHVFNLVGSEDPAFLSGQQASIVMDDIKIGIIGVLHPDVVGPKGFNINLATCALEMNIEPFLDWL